MRILKTMTAGMMLAAALSAAPAEAKRIRGLERFLEREISSVQEAVERSETDQVARPTGWYLRRFLFRIKSPVGIDIPFLAKFQIVPEVEMLWQRDYPEGWGSYKP